MDWKGVVLMIQLKAWEGVGGHVYVCVCVCICVVVGGWDLERLTLQDSRLVGISRKTGFEDSAPNPTATLLAFPSILQVSEDRSLTQRLIVLYPRSIKKIKMDFKQDRHTFYSP